MVKFLISIVYYLSKAIVKNINSHSSCKSLQQSPIKIDVLALTSLIVFTLQQYKILFASARESKRFIQEHRKLGANLVKE